MPPIITVLETDRLRLRHLTPDDAAFIVELVNGPAWIRFIGDRAVHSLADARDYIAAGPTAMVARYGFGVGAVERKTGGEPVGLCGLIKRDTLPDVDLGFALLERFRGHGYALEIAAAVLAYGQTTLKLPRIVAMAAADNERSARLLGKLGFRFERMAHLDATKPDCRLFAFPSSAAVGPPKI